MVVWIGVVCLVLAPFLIFVPVIIATNGTSVSERQAYNEMVENEATISFEMFKSLYAIQPENWQLHGPFVTYVRHYKKVYFETYSDYKKYVKWREEAERLQQQKECSEIQQDLLNCWQEDIKTYREKNYKDILSQLEALRQEGTSEDVGILLERTINLWAEINGK